jgi:hypothetical protein
MLFSPLRYKAPLAYPQMFSLYFYSYTILSDSLSLSSALRGESIVKQSYDSIKLTDMFMIFYCTKFGFAECNSSIKHNMNFNFHSPSNFMILVFHKNSPNKILYVRKSLNSVQDFMVPH